MTSFRERFLEALLESATDYAIVAMDRAGLVTSWNAGARHVLGWTEEEILGQPGDLIFTPEDRAASVPAQEQHTALCDGRSSDERWHQRKDGGRFWANGELMPLRDEAGAVQGFVKILRDRTAQRLAAEQQRADAEFMRGVLAASADCIKVLDADGRLLFMSEGGKRVMEVVDFGLIQGCSWLDLWAEYGDADARAAMVTAQDGGTGRFQGRARTMAGHPRWWDVQVTPIRDAAGGVVQLLAVARDISDRKQAETALQQINQTLEQRIATALAEREEIESTLRQSQKMEAVGQLTGGIAHDFNNLLTGIVGSLEMIQTRIRQDRAGEAEKYIAAAQGAARRAASLTHRLLAFSRRQTLDPLPISVNRLVVGMEEMIRRTVGPGVELEVLPEPRLWVTLCDLNQLENALLNLCINARDAMPEGGRLAIETANVTLDDHAARTHGVAPGDYVTLCVTDSGMGMPPEVIDRVFEPFFTTKPVGQGTGLGLSMVYGFAQQSGGQVRIESEPDEGTAVRLFLPRHDGEVTADLDPAGPAHSSRDRADGTVLVVDDEATVRMLVSEVLGDLGYAALEAADAVAALGILSGGRRVDLLVTDLGLPGGMSGRQLAEAARSRQPHLKVLFITGYADQRPHGNELPGPGAHVLTKPFAMEALAARIQQVLAT